MRKVLLMMVAVLLMACSVTDDDKARMLIDTYMQKNSNDPSSVEIIEVEKVQPDSVYGYIETEEHDRLMEAFNFACEMAEMRTSYNRFKEAEEAIAEADSLKQLLEKQSAEFKPYQRGMKTIVQYRAKNAMGALVKSTARVKFDKDMTEIISFEDMND
ncbi:MAG: hypothetical protein IKH01_00580 [Prevotella sp.]|nr:hypothetical protein [Prevotella sp.]